MDVLGPLWSQVILISSLLLAALSAIVSFRVASRSTQQRNWLRRQVLTQTSDAHYAKLRAEMLELCVALEKTNTTVKRLSSRAGMADVRERRANEPPPLGTPKAQLRLHYGLLGKTPQEIAKIQLQETS